MCSKQYIKDNKTSSSWDMGVVIIGASLDLHSLWIWTCPDSLISFVISWIWTGPDVLVFSNIIFWIGNGPNSLLAFVIF